MQFPIGDWQFWVVSIIALGGLLVILKPLFPGRDRSNCTGCKPPGGGRDNRRVRLTMGKTDQPEK